MWHLPVHHFFILADLAAMLTTRIASLVGDLATHVQMLRNNTEKKD